MSSIDTLTPEQEAKFPEYVEKWTAIGNCTDRIDEGEAKEAIINLYKRGGLEPPKEFRFVPSPHAAAQMCVDEGIFTKAELSGKFCFGPNEAGWAAMVSFFRDELGLVKETDMSVGLIEVTEKCGWFIPMVDLCIIADRPNVLHLDDEGRLDCEDGLAIGYTDGEGVYSVRGVVMPKDVITDRSTLTVKRIEDEENIEVRRIMIDLYGMEAYITDSGAEEIDRGTVSQSGSLVKLYRKEQDDDETIITAKVINSTPEPDGTIKNYFLRVPPDITTVKDAIAWGFGMAAESYNPSFET